MKKNMILSMLSLSVVTIISCKKTDSTPAPDPVAVISAISPVSGNIYCAEYFSQQVTKYSSTGSYTVVAGLLNTSGYVDATGTAARFVIPAGITVDASENLYITETGNHKIRKISPTGVVTTIAGGSNAGFAEGVGSAALFNTPIGIAGDFSSNTLFIADAFNNKIRKIIIE